MTLALIDLLKALACCLIVLHHLAFYGPMADHAAALFPTLFGFLADPARMAVQIFLVIAGFLAVRGLMPMDSLVRRVAQRYFRLALPLWAALVVAIAANALADEWMDHRSIGSPPQGLQVLSHLVLLQDITGHEALSAGVWYVAIDFQLYSLLAVLALVASRFPRPREALAVLVLVLVAASAFFVNRDPSWDVAAPYHWASYGLGVAVGLDMRPVASSRRMGFALIAGCLVAAALLLEFRPRLGVALVTAGLLMVWLPRSERLLPHVGQGIRGLSRISYSVFLIHFPVCLVVNAAWSAFLPNSAWLQLLGVVTAFKLSLLAGWVFHRLVEAPLMRRLAGESRQGQASNLAT